MTPLRSRILVLALMALLISACQGLGGEPRIVGSASQPQGPSIDTSGASDELASTMTLGGEVWMTNCAECHGRTGEGSGTAQGAPLPDLTSYTDEQILASITNGVRDVMPAFGDRLSAEQLNAAMTYAKMISLAVQRGMIQGEQPAAESQVDAQSNPAASEVEVVDPLGVVVGRVTNGTEGAAIPQELGVELHVLKSEVEEQTFETQIAADGSYRLEGVPFNSAYQYVLTAAYGDLMFVSDIVTVDPAAAELDVPLTLYEGAAPETAVQISTVSAQVMAQADQMQVIQIVSFTNTSDRVYFAVSPEGVGTSVHLNLPAGAAYRSTSSERYFVSADGTQVFDTRPLLPGRSSVMHLAYTMPYSGTGTAVTQTLDYPFAGGIDVSLATQGLTINGDNFTEGAPLAMGERTYPSFVAQFNSEAGTPITFTVSGTPIASEQSTSTAVETPAVSPIAYVLIGAGAAALLIAAVLAIRDRSAKAGTPDKSEIAALMEQITQLDSQHQAGKLNAREYERKRAALKTQLGTLMKSR